MTQSSGTGAPRGALSANALSAGLTALIQRQRALHSAWTALAPSGLSAEKADIAQTGRALNDDLMALIGSEASDSNFEAMAEIEERLACLEDEMRAIAVKVPIAQLRTTLPDCVSQNRRGLLDLLDLILGPELRGRDGIEMRIPMLDYLITLLCSAGPGRPPHDPVQLTPRLQNLCGQSGVDYDPRLPEIEAEFFHAADMYEADARGEEQMRALTRRKVELGASYFAPQVLRAIVTYNTALLSRIDSEALASQDWGSLSPLIDDQQPVVSVFESPALSQLADAIRRRARGNAPEMSAIDRVAWCLDLEYPSADERRALLAGSAEDDAELIASAILVGLLCRSSVVLEDEFPSIGLSAELLFESWVPELSAALQQRVNQQIASDDYRAACALSELKTRYLYTSMAEVRRKTRGRTPTPRPAAEAVERPAKTATTAKPIIEEAIADAQLATRNPKRSSWRELPLRRLAAVAATAAIASLALGHAFVWNDDNARLNGDELQAVSRFLSRGLRSDRGRGPAFVGRIRDDWSALDASDQMLVAADLVGTLREDGVRDVMIYDGDGRLRIQALGEQPPRLLPGRTREP